MRVGELLLVELSRRDCIADLLIECSYPVWSSWVCGWFVRYASCVFGLLRYVDVWLAEYLWEDLVVAIVVAIVVGLLV